MRTAETISALAEFELRGAGTDAERRAALWLSSELEAPGREVRIEPFWCRPNWALAHAWHVALGLVGSLLSVSTPRVGGALLLVALLSLIADALLGISPGRRLTPERASQNVVGSATDADEAAPVRLIITANYDAGRLGLAYRGLPRRVAARLRVLAHGLVPGWLGWVAIALVWLEVIAIVRLQGANGATVGFAQLIPTVVLVLALALLLDLASADLGPGAGDNASGVAVAIALARALDAAPPRGAAVDVVLAGASDGSGIGLRRYLRARKGALKPGNTIVLGIHACAAGAPAWWLSDGALLPFRYSAKLRELGACVAKDEPHLGARPNHGRGATSTLPARLARLPAIAIGCLDERGLVLRSHQPSDTAAAVQPDALDRAVEFTLLFVDAIDGFLRHERAAAAAVDH
jgi:hypothetical protein